MNRTEKIKAERHRVIEFVEGFLQNSIFEELPVAAVVRKDTFFFALVVEKV